MLEVFSERTWLVASVITSLLFFVYYLYDVLFIRRSLRRLPYPLIGGTSPLMPAFLLNWRFATNAIGVLKEGYYKYKYETFQVLISSQPTLVLPQSLLDELASLPPTTASTAAALEHDFQGQWTGHFQMLLENRLHSSILQRRLTPNLGAMVPELRRELEVALEELLPDGSDWKKVNIHDLMTHLAIRMSAYILLGPQLCRDPRWSKLVVKWTENTGITFAILRFLPPLIRPFVVKLLPSHWISVHYARKAHTVLEPHLNELIRATEDDAWGPDPESNTKDGTTLSWLAEIAKGNSRNPTALTQVLLILVFASVHSIMVRLVNTLYDIIEHPDLLSELRDEAIEEMNAETATYEKTGARALHIITQTAELQPRLDSTLRESQRLLPILMVGMKRIFKKDYTFKDGTHVPNGTHVCMATLDIGTDPANIPDPLRFDGLRSYRQRMQEKDPKALSDDRYAFAYAGDRFEMGFGYGRMSCPGRFFSSIAIKMALTRFIVDYDIEYPEGKGRPPTVKLHDFFVPWPLGKVRLRRRIPEVSKES